MSNTRVKMAEKTKRSSRTKGILTFDIDNAQGILTLNQERVKGIFTVRNDRGLHTRPCAELVKCASHFEADVKLTYHKMEVNAKSLLGILMLAAAKGSRIMVEAAGPDAQKAVDSILALAANKFNIKY